MTYGVSYSVTTYSAKRIDGQKLIVTVVRQNCGRDSIEGAVREEMLVWWRIAELPDNLGIISLQPTAYNLYAASFRCGKFVHWAALPVCVTPENCVYTQSILYTPAYFSNEGNKTIAPSSVFRQFLLMTRIMK